MLSFPYMLYLNNAPLMYLLLRYLIFIFDYHLLPPDDPRWDLHSGVFVLEERVLQLAARGQIPLEKSGKSLLAHRTSTSRLGLLCLW